jgi:hypothetical protein
MLDSVGVAMDRKIRTENSKVSKASTITSIKKEGDEDQGHPDFNEELRHVQKKEKIEVIAEKHPVEEEDIIVSSSLNKRFEEHRLMNKLVNEKFVNNPFLKDKIEFDEVNEDK